MKILMVGDLVGSPGRRIFARVVSRLKESGEVDFVVVNAENSAGGRGLTPVLADSLFTVGADIITMGDHTWDQKELRSYLSMENRIIRPANFAPDCPGRGYVTINTQYGRITVINLIGRVYIGIYDCPFRVVDSILMNEQDIGKIILVDIHAEATSEKIVMGYYLDGRVSAVVGTHTHVQTSDDKILPKGTGYITDLGMTGPKYSALGRDLKSVTSMLITGIHSGFKVAEEEVVLEGVIFDINMNTGKVKKITRIREPE